MSNLRGVHQHTPWEIKMSRRASARAEIHQKGDDSQTKEFVKQKTTEVLDDFELQRQRSVTFNRRSLNEGEFAEECEVFSHRVLLATCLWARRAQLVIAFKPDDVSCTGGSASRRLLETYASDGDGDPDDYRDGDDSPSQAPTGQTKTPPQPLATPPIADVAVDDAIKVQLMTRLDEIAQGQTQILERLAALEENADDDERFHTRTVWALRDYYAQTKTRALAGGLRVSGGV